MHSATKTKSNQTTTSTSNGQKGAAKVAKVLPVQPKLTVGEPGDKYEQEADAMADQIVQRSAVPDTIQKKCTACAKEEAIHRLPITPLNSGISKKAEGDKKEDLAHNIDLNIQRQVEPAKEKPGEEDKESDSQVKNKKVEESGKEPEKGLIDVPFEEPKEEEQDKLPDIQTQQIQTKSFTVPKVSPNLESKLHSSKNQGEPIDLDTKSQMESGFGRDLGAVRIHSDSTAIQMNQELRAQAFTHGSDIYFNSGKYDPDSKKGQHLLAHEITHTIQQGAIKNQIQRSEEEPRPQLEEPNRDVRDEGQNVQHKMNSRIKEEIDVDEARSEGKEKKSIDLGEVKDKKIEIDQSGDSKVDIDHGKKMVPRNAENEKQLKSKSKALPPIKTKPNKEEKKASQLRQEQAKSAASMSQNLLQKAQSLEMPQKPKDFEHPEIKTPVDSQNQALPGNPQVDTKVKRLGFTGEMFRTTGFHLQKDAIEGERMGLSLEATVWKLKEDLANAEEGTARIKSANNTRGKLSERAKNAHGKSVEKQRFVKAEAPKSLEDAEKAKVDSSKLASEAQEKSDNSKKSAPDPDAREDAEKQGKQMGTAAHDALIADNTVDASANRAQVFIKESEQSARQNAKSSATIRQTDETISGIKERISEMEAKNAETSASIEGVLERPRQIQADAKEAGRKGTRLIDASVTMEKELISTQKNYLDGMKSIESIESAREKEKKKQQGAPQQLPDKNELELAEMADMNDDELEEHLSTIPESHKNDLLNTLEHMATLEVARDDGTTETEGPRFKAETGLANMSSISDLKLGNNQQEQKKPQDPREPEITRVENQRIQRVTSISGIADQNLGLITAAQKAMLAQKLMGESLKEDIAKIDVWQMGKDMLLGIIDPTVSIKGVFGGLDQVITSFANLGNWKSWEKDPLGNALQAGASIFTGLATIFSSVLGVAATITALLGALIIISFGSLLIPFTPALLFLAKVMTFCGWGALATGALSVSFNRLAYLKNLYDAASAKTSSNLFGNVDQMKKNAMDGLTGAMSVTAGLGAGKMGAALRNKAKLFRRMQLKKPGIWMKYAGRQMKRTALGMVVGIPILIFTKGRNFFRFLKDRIKSLFLKKKLDGPEGLNGKPKKADLDQKKDTLKKTSPKEGNKLTKEEIDAELDIVRKTKPRKISDGDYVEEVILPNKHKWRKNKNGQWCRFSNGEFCINTPLDAKLGKTGQAELIEFWEKQIEFVMNDASLSSSRRNRLLSTYQKYLDRIKTADGRPSWRQTEMEMEYFYKQVGGEAEVPYLHGERQNARNIPDSTRPDIKLASHLIEVKNYKLFDPNGNLLSNRYNSLKRVLFKQLSSRAVQGPRHIHQQPVFLDLRGQNVGLSQSMQMAKSLAKDIETELRTVYGPTFSYPASNIQIIRW